MEELHLKLEEDLNSVDIKEIAKNGKDKANERAKVMYPDIFRINHEISNKSFEADEEEIFLPDTNLFIAAILSGKRSLKLLLKLIERRNLVVNDVLLEEYTAIGDIFRSQEGVVKLLGVCLEIKNYFLIWLNIRNKREST
jgi:hypothetical protein